jgi:hypothetical protein
MILALLIISHPGGREAAHPLRAGVTTVGRAPDNDLALDDPQVSRHHLRLTASAQEVEVTDLGSAGGTFIDGERLPPGEPRLLRRGGTLRLGATTIRLEIYAHSAPPDAPTRSAPAPGERLLERLAEGLQGVLQVLRGERQSAAGEEPPVPPPPPHEDEPQAPTPAPPDPSPAGEPVEERRLDAAIPGVVAVGQRTRLLVQVRFRDSPPLGREDWPTDTKPETLEQGSNLLRLTFPGGRAVPLHVRITTESFEVREPEKVVEVPPGAYSPLVSFQLVARAPGPALVDVEIFTPERRYLGVACIDAEISAAAPEEAPLRVGQVSLRPVVVQPIASVELELERADGGMAATLTLFQPDGRTESVLAADVPVALDEAALREAALDPAAYGKALTAQLFADQRLQEAWARARSFAAASGGDLRVRLRLDSHDALHGLRWETLLDPASGQPLALSERALVSRYLASADLTPIELPAREQLRAALLVASPADLGGYGLAPIDVAGEVAAARMALGAIPTTLLAGHPEATGRATLDGLRAGLREGAQILYVVAHGSQVEGEPYLWLERADGASERVSGAELLTAIHGAPRQPLLVVLASCQSAGGGFGDALLALGPRLARAGVPAVIGFQGDVSVATARRLLRPLFAELAAADGVIDRALAVARAGLRGGEWWQAVLWLRTRDGRLWAG